MAVSPPTRVAARRSRRRDPRRRRRRATSPLSQTRLDLEHLANGAPYVGTRPAPNTSPTVAPKTVSFPVPAASRAGPNSFTVAMPHLLRPGGAPGARPERDVRDRHGEKRPVVPCRRVHLPDRGGGGTSGRERGHPAPLDRLGPATGDEDAGGRRLVEGVELARLAQSLATAPGRMPLAGVGPQPDGRLRHERHTRHRHGPGRHGVRPLPGRVVDEPRGADELGLAPGVVAVASVKATDITVELPHEKGR